MLDNIEIPPAPEGINQAAKEFWVQVHKVTNLSDHERTVLVQLCTVLTRIDELEAALRADGRYVIKGVQGSTVIHPLFTEIRMQQNMLNTLYRTLSLHNFLEESSDTKNTSEADPNVISMIERAAKNRKVT